MIGAFLCPGLSLYFNGRKGLGILFLVLQVTIIGWAVGALVAVKHLQMERKYRQYNRDKESARRRQASMKGGD